jgi:hypothetical protein
MRSGGEFVPSFERKMDGEKEFHVVRGRRVRDWTDDVCRRTAWLIWRGAYLTQTISWRNKLLIPIYWYVGPLGF